MDGIDYRPHSQNPFHSWWYNVFHLSMQPLRLIGFYPCLRRCGWTKSGARISIYWAWR